MNNQVSNGLSWALLFARLTVGLIFMMAGVFKVFELGPAEHVRRFFLPYQDTFLPIWSLWAVGAVIPFVELIAGALLVVGWRARSACVALGIVLVVVTFGHLLTAPLSPFNAPVFPRLALVLFIVVSAGGTDRFSIDGLLKKRRARQTV